MYEDYIQRLMAEEIRRQRLMEFADPHQDLRATATSLLAEKTARDHFNSLASNAAAEMARSIAGQSLAELNATSSLAAAAQVTALQTHAATDMVMAHAQQQFMKAQIQAAIISGAISTDANLASAVMSAQHSIEDQYRKFATVDLPMVTRLLHDRQGPDLTQTLIEKSMMTMQHPWLHAGQPERSLTAFMDLQTVGSLVQAADPFALETVAGLRRGLGDWTRPIAFNERRFNDPVERSEFYVAQGFDYALTDFPAPAFDEAAERAGLTFPEELGTDDDDDDDEARAADTYIALRRFERELRTFVDRRMSAVFGENWFETRNNSDIRRGCRRRQAQAVKDGAVERELIHYCEFSDYVAIIIQPEHWGQVFAPVFLRVESVQESFQRLIPVRRGTMHSRIVTLDDQLFARAEIRRLSRVFNH